MTLRINAVNSRRGLRARALMTGQTKRAANARHPQVARRALMADPMAPGAHNVGNGLQRPSLRVLRGHNKKSPARGARGNQRAGVGGKKSALCNSTRLARHCSRNTALSDAARYCAEDMD
jgi:hypothetical protein